MIAAVSSNLTMLADALAASHVMQVFVAPVMASLCIAASLGCTFFLVIGGMQYITSRGNPENLEHAKQVIKNALIGLVIVLAAATLTAILTHAYSNATAGATLKLPQIASVQSKPTDFWDVVMQVIVHVLQDLISTIGQPFADALSYFTKSTPLMGDNSAVFNMWLVITGMSDVLFVIVVALLGFHVMSFSVLDFDEIDIKKMLPQLALVFLLMNTSLFAIDGIISLSNVMIHAIQDAFPPMTLWDLLDGLTKQSSSMGLGALLIMVAFLVLTVLLLVYYVVRLITLYIGAALSPFVLMLYLIPAFKDTAIAAAKAYLITIFTLFVQVVIMQLATSLFLGMLEGTDSGQPNSLMALIVGLATIWALLKTPGVMKELSHAASMPHAARQLAGVFMRSAGSMYEISRSTKSDIRTVVKTFSKTEEKSGKGRKGSGGQTIIRAENLRTGETRPAAFATEVHARRSPAIEGGEA